MKRIIILSVVAFLAACSNNAVKTNAAAPVATPVNEVAKESVAPQAMPKAVTESKMEVNLSLIHI